MNSNGIKKFTQKSIKQSFILTLTLLLVAICPSRVYARPLVQTTTLQSDFEDLVTLDLMKTKRNSQPEVEQAFENVWKTTVKISGEGYYASGSIWDITKDYIVIVTNKHVIHYFDEDSIITFADGNVENGTLFGFDEQEDIGFIEVSTSNFSYQELLEMRSVRVASVKEVPLEVNTPFFMVDVVTDSSQQQCYDGTITDNNFYIEEFDRNMILGDAYAKPGMSGSGMYDYCGNYIGMLTGGTTQNQIAGIQVMKIIEAYERMNKSDINSY